MTDMEEPNPFKLPEKHTASETGCFWITVAIAVLLVVLFVWAAMPRIYVR